ncbi:MAG TPA: M23 family metallopeptidase [Vicinamibacteria bacterium]|nr:M23 family metallopeptidase [Vicinamibacteria bacterium]
MKRAALALVPAFVLSAGAPAFPQDVVKRVGTVSFVVDAGLAFPGGFFVVRLLSRTGLGASWAIFDGRRAPFYSGARGPRALVPVPVGAAPGRNVIGVEIMARRGRQRVPIDVTVGERAYPPRLFRVPEPRRPLLQPPLAQHDGRVLLGLLRTQTPSQSPPPLKAPVTAAAAGFGSALTYEGAAVFESLVDSTWGEVHRGLDFEVPAGTPVLAPATGTVLFAGPLLLSGQTVVIDHGQGVVSALFHMSRLDVTVGQIVGPREPVGLSGDSGICLAPMVQWRVYLHGIAVDPRLLDRSLD